MRVGFEETAIAIEESAAWKRAVDVDEKAQVIACEIIELYGDLTALEWQQFRREGKIWRDHPAYQAALAALRIK